MIQYSVAYFLLVKDPFEWTQLFRKGSQKMMTNDITMQINKSTMKTSITFHFAIKYIM